MKWVLKVLSGGAMLLGAAAYIVPVNAMRLEYNTRMPCINTALPVPPTLKSPLKNECQYRVSGVEIVRDNDRFLRKYQETHKTPPEFERSVPYDTVWSAEALTRQMAARQKLRMTGGQWRDREYNDGSQIHPLMALTFVFVSYALRDPLDNDVVSQ
ncbi:hypothetical protein ACOA8Y_002351 [Serratia marcescens]|uniref:Uncharacterized protein n=1 Tax=Serratia marcescens TaxID=615 RepID=A0AB35Z7Z8_SERMA|nr:hypothetical protein [Serratia marcescens]MBH3235740.1 hypothetical protein [Serratia marcescens]